MKSARPIGRALSGLLRGTGSEFVKGDLLEDYRRRLGDGMSRAGAEWAYVQDVLMSAGRWWTPDAVRRRRRNERDGSYDPRRAWRGMGGGSMGNWVTETRQAVRALMRRPGFALLTIVTLGLGIGATTTIVSVVDTVVLRPLPYPDADRIVAAGVVFPTRPWREDVPGLQHLAGANYLNMLEVREQTRSLEQLAGVHLLQGLIPDQGQGPELVRMAAVTEDFFDIVGAPLALGRSFLPDEFLGDAQVTLLSHSTWVNRYGGDPDVLGRVLPEGSSRGATVVGILAPEFSPPEALIGNSRTGQDIEFWIPLEVNHPRYQSRGARSVSLIGRLAEGATIESTRAELETVAARIAAEYPEGSVYPDGAHFGYGVNPLHAETVGGAQRTLVIFLGAAALLLMISGLNAANLLLVRGLDRSAELGVRRALGAGRSTLARQLLTESLLLSAAGGALGVLLAYGGVGAFLRFSPTIPRMAEVAVDGRILAIAAAVSIGAGVLTGLAPLIGLGRRDLATGLRKGSGRTSSGGGRMRSAMVAVQLSLALVLTVGASLLMHSFVKLRAVDPGFEPEGLSAFMMPVKVPDGPPTSWQAWDEVLTLVRETPGVTSAAGTSNLPFEDPNWAPSVLLPGDTPEERRTGVSGYAITPGYLATAGIEVLQGREFVPTDGPDAESVVIVNAEFLRQHYPDGDPLGMVIRLGSDEDSPAARIVGVADDVVMRRAEEGWQPAVYVPYTQNEWPWVKVVVRSSLDDVTLADGLRAAAAAFSPAVPPSQMGPVSSRIRSVQTGPRFQALLIGVFSTVALLLACIGLYGSLAHSVGRRMGELGVRVAMGAAPRAIYSLVLKHGMVIAGVGLVVGLAASLALTRLLEQYLFGVAPLDPVAFIGASGALTIAALVAVLRPARRAAAVDVVDCLRAE